MKTKYLIISSLLLIKEILIALFAKDQFIRPILGDYLATILLTYILATFLKIEFNKIAILALAMSYTIEAFQFIHILKLLNLDKIKILNILVGNSFSWTDMIAYTLGTITVLTIHNFEKIKSWTTL